MCPARNTMTIQKGLRRPRAARSDRRLKNVVDVGLSCHYGSHARWVGHFWAASEIDGQLSEYQRSDRASGGGGCCGEAQLEHTPRTGRGRAPLTSRSPPVHRLKASHTPAWLYTVALSRAAAVAAAGYSGRRAPAIHPAMGAPARRSVAACLLVDLTLPHTGASGRCRWRPCQRPIA